MVYQEIDGIRFKMGTVFDFHFLKKYGKVFRVYDDQDSGNICFGIENPEGRLFVKFAGAQTAEYDGDVSEAVQRLKATVPVYQSIQHRALIRYRASEEIAQGFAMIFDWADGECMGRMYEESHKIIMNLPTEEKLQIYAEVIDFMIAVAKMGYVAVDFYDGSIMYDLSTKKVTICDIDFFRKSPTVNDMGRMWGSSRFMSPEEYELGAPLDEITNVFTIGRMGFSIFTDSDFELEHWPLSESAFHVLEKAASPERSDRYTSIAELKAEWLEALNNEKGLYQMIQRIQKYPGMYLGSKTLTPLSHFIDGYRAAERDLGVNWHGSLFPLDFYFMHYFAAFQLKTDCSSAGWCYNVLMFCHGDEEKALNLFFDLYQEFMNLRMKRYWKAILTKENIAWNDEMKRCRTETKQGPEPIYKNPIAVYVLELTIPAYMLIVETINDVRFEPWLCSSIKEAKGNGCIPCGAETYFGKIDTWEEYEAENLYFDKVIEMR